MAHTADTNSSPFHVTTQDVAIPMFASVARILLMLGTAILIGEMAAGTVNEHGEPVD